MKALAIGDEKSAILIIQQSQTDPQKALAELVENSIDARATEIRITRTRTKDGTEIVVEDNGEGVNPGKDGDPDFDRVARGICDSYKKQLEASDRQNIQGEFAIGLLGFAAIGSQVEMVSRTDQSQTRGMRLKAGSVEYETFSPQRVLSSHGTVVRVKGVRKEIQNRLTAEKLSKYLGTELRDRIRATRVSIRINDKLPGGKELLVKPREFEGERLLGIRPIETPYGKVKFEIYATGEEADGRVGVARRGTRLLEDVCLLEEADQEPWNGGRLEGLITFDALTPAPASRRGIVPDENLRSLLDALAEIAPTILAQLRVVEERREEKLGRELIRQIQETFASILDELPADYSWFDTERGGPLPGPRTGGPSKRREFRISRGPLDTVEIVPHLAQLAPGELRKFTAHALDPTGALIPVGVNFAWRLGGDIAKLTHEGAVATLQAGVKEGEGRLHVTAQQAHVRKDAAARFVILELKPKAQGKKLPFLEGHYRPAEDWRSRWISARNVIEYNTGHSNFLRAKELGRRGLLRYLSLLVAKELVLHNFSGAQQTLLLERMVEVVGTLQARV